MHLLELSKMKNSLVGRDQKMEYLYQYLCGTQFKNRIESIVMAFSELQKDLATEKRAMERIWRKRGQEIERVIENTAGLYGDLQGMVGTGLPSIQALELPGDEFETEQALDSDKSSLMRRNSVLKSGLDDQQSLL
jgi:hypothetical protein